MNCSQRKTEDPCDKCVSCLEITKSVSVNVIEIDAASNRGIDEIRRLRENVKFAPASAKYKIYIIDEVHMLTKEAFNAILKTLEEPPAHAIFVLATTEPEKVLETITSRCQTFNFKLITEKDIKEMLQRIAEKEKAEYEEDGLWMLASAAKGSMRDAQSIMDKVLSYSGGKIIADEVSEILGLIPREFLFSYAEAFKNNDIKKALLLTDNLVKEGYSVHRLFNELLLHFRNLMFAKIFGEATDLMGFNKDYADNLAKSAGSFSRERLIWIIDFLTMNFQRMRWTDSPRIVMDTILFKLCQKYVGFDDIMNLIDDEGVSEAGGASIKTDTGLSEMTQKKKPKQGGRWEKVIKLLEEKSPALYHYMKESDVSLSGKRITINYKTLMDITDKHRQILQEKIREVFGDGYYPDIKKVKSPGEGTKKLLDIEEEPQKQSISPALIEREEPIVAKIVNVFDGRIERNM